MYYTRKSGIILNIPDFRVCRMLYLKSRYCYEGRYSMENNPTINAVCITADIIASRESGKDKELPQVVHFLNEKYDGKCITMFTKRMGDEIFGILADFSDAYWVLKDLFTLSIQKALPLYVGIGFGVVKKDNKHHVHDVNGTAIWNSADALKVLKENDQSVKYFQNEASTFRYFYKANNRNVPHMLINYMTALIFDKVQNRTQKQAEVIATVEKFPSLNLEAIGKKIGYEQNAGLNVSKTLRRAEYHFVRDAELELILLLEHIQKAR